MKSFNQRNAWRNDQQNKKEKNNDFVWLDGTVEKVLPGSLFIVKLENEREITAYISGKLKKHYIKILYGDKVNVMISKYELTRGRICERYICHTTQPPINPKNKKNVRKVKKRKTTPRAKLRKK